MEEIGGGSDGLCSWVEVHRGHVLGRENLVDGPGSRSAVQMKIIIRRCLSVWRRPARNGCSGRFLFI